MNVPESVKYVIILVLITLIQAIQAANLHNSMEEKAPSCKKLSIRSLDCSNLMLKALPNDIPNTITSLNLSSTYIHLDESTFSSCCVNLLELDLSNNEIFNISPEVFKNLVNLTKLILRNNSISEFDSETFSDLPNLVHIDLSKNPLILQRGFINSSKLTSLSLDDCNLSEIPDDAFSGIKQLEMLTLNANSFEEDFDTSAFEDLKSLTKLEMRNISRDSTKDLCDKLTSIDAINFEGFNLSCFIYTTEGNFDEAIVGNDPPIEQPLTLPKATLAPKSQSTLVTTTLSTTVAAATATNNSNIVHISDQKLDIVEPTTEKIDHATVDVDNETLKFILIGILAVTLTGILIGLICRADVCGIKTKLCRSKKANNNNRRTPADTVSPFEEIPLNTVTANSNGKRTIEGQG